MFGLNIGRLGALASSVARAWSPAALWPTGTEPGMWIDPSNLASQWQDSTGTTPVSTPGTVADSSNPVGLALDLRLGATALTDPGNHLLQATSTARPLGSARVNLLTYTEDFSNAVWDKGGCSATSQKITEDSSTSPHVLLYGGGATPHKTASVRAGPGTCRYLSIWSGFAISAYATFDLQSGVVTEQGLGVIATSISASVLGGYNCSVVFSTSGVIRVAMSNSATAGWNLSYTGNGSAYLDIYSAQFESGTTATPYQAILTDGSSYPSTGFPIYQKYDGTDDGMATASFAAGTLTSGMDCMIAVRRDSATQAVCGLYTSPVRAKYFGHAQDSSAVVCFSESGSPTVWVDGIQLTGGTSVTADTLHTALTVGDWHILEFRGLDMSAWTSLSFGEFGSGFSLNGAQGGILLFPSSTPTADRDAARTWLGAKVGLTL